MNKRKYSGGIDSRPIKKTGTMRRRFKKSSASMMSKPQMPLQGSLNKIYAYRQFVYTTAITQTAGAVTAGAINMTLGQVPQFATFNSLYDAYRIDYMEITFRSRNTDNGLLSAAVQVIPLIYTAVDKDDSTTPTLAQIIEYQGVQTHPTSLEQFTIRFAPATRGLIWDGAAAQAGARLTKQWIDAAQTGIPHYGLKYVITAGVGGQTSLATWDVDLYCGVSFKNVR